MTVACAYDGVCVSLHVWGQSCVMCMCLYFIMCLSLGTSMSVSEIASTAVCLCSIWRLQEITGVLLEDCMFLPVTLHVLQ